MQLFKSNRSRPRKYNPFPKRAPAGAHGQRTIDDSYFSIWFCHNGHGAAGDVDKPSEKSRLGCAMCRFDDPDTPLSWRRATPAEAHTYLLELEGLRIYSGLGFRLMPEVREAKPDPEALMRCIRKQRVAR